MSKRKVRKHKSNHYSNDGEFYLEMVDWIAKCDLAKANEEPLPPITESIGRNIWIIVHGLARRPNFSRYTWKYLMIDDAIENCVKYLHNFDPVKYKSPYSYINMIAWQAFVRRIKKEKKDLASHKDYIKSLGGLNEDMFQSDPNSSMQEQIITDNVHNFFDNGCYQTKTSGVE